MSQSDTSVYSLLLPNLLDNLVIGGTGYIIETNDYLFRVDSCTPNTYGRISSIHTTVEISSIRQRGSLSHALAPLCPETNGYTPPAGLESVFADLKELISGAFQHADLYAELNTRPPRGVLLHGPPGVGKTWIVSLVTRVMNANLHVLTVDNVISPFPGQSQTNLRQVFAEALQTAESGTPTVLLIDELDALAPNRTVVPGMATVVAQLLTLLDGIDHKSTHLSLIVVGATNRPNAIDPAVRRLGRMDREIHMPPPSAYVRTQILTSLLAEIPTEPQVKDPHWLSQFSDCLPGYVGADLSALVRESCQGYIARKIVGGGGLVSCQDLCVAQAKVPPSLRRGHLVHLGAGHVSSWDDIGGLEDVKKHLIKAAIWPIQRATQFKALGISLPKGILMYGPPGCSKTTLVRVLAQQTQSSFYCIAPADVFSAFVGEAERILREAFSRARSTAPSILFLDEIDVLVGGDRLDANDDNVKHRVLLTLLAEMDGIDSDNSVLVIAATNYPDRLDPALVRPGRLDRCVYVRPPTRDERIDIFKVVTRNMPIDSAVDLRDWADKMPLASGADIIAIAREVALDSLRTGSETIHDRHFDQAISTWHPVITAKLLEYYESMFKRFRT